MYKANLRNYSESSLIPATKFITKKVIHCHTLTYQMLKYFNC